MYALYMFLLSKLSNSSHTMTQLFSRWTPSKQGFACSVKAPPRQDFAIFMRFLVVGAKETLAETEDARKEQHDQSLGGKKKRINFAKQLNMLDNA